MVADFFNSPWLTDFLNSPAFSWVVLPCLIFLARLADVSLGTLRVIMISRGVRPLAAFIGFFEVIIWLIAISQILRHLTNVFCYLAYGGGFAAGIYVGMLVERRICVGKVLVRVITAKEAIGLIERLREVNCGVTSLDAKGSMGPVKVIFSVIARRDLEDVVGIIRQFDPGAFYTVDDAKHVSEGVFPQREKRSLLPRLIRKGK